MFLFELCKYLAHFYIILMYARVCAREYESCPKWKTFGLEFLEKFSKKKISVPGEVVCVGDRLLSWGLLF
jgi:hypothetical protein